VSVQDWAKHTGLLSTTQVMAHRRRLLHTNKQAVAPQRAVVSCRPAARQRRAPGFYSVPWSAPRAASTTSRAADGSVSPQAQSQGAPPHSVIGAR
jgi:hypothetical protein